MRTRVAKTRFRIAGEPTPVQMVGEHARSKTARKSARMRILGGISRAALPWQAAGLTIGAVPAIFLNRFRGFSEESREQKERKSSAQKP